MKDLNAKISHLKKERERERKKYQSLLSALLAILQLKYLVSINKYLWTKICCHYAAREVDTHTHTTQILTQPTKKKCQTDFNLFWFKHLKLYNSHENLMIIIWSQVNKNSALSTSIGWQSINWLLIFQIAFVQVLHLKWWSPLNN